MIIVKVNVIYTYFAYFFKFDVDGLDILFGYSFDVPEDIKRRVFDCRSYSSMLTFYNRIDTQELPEDYRIALEDPFIEIDLKREVSKMGYTDLVVI